MINKKLFKKPRNKLEESGKAYKKSHARIPDELCAACASCRKMLFKSELEENLNVCPACGYHFRINARTRLHYLLNDSNFIEHDRDLVSANLLRFPGYDSKLMEARSVSNENESVVCGHSEIQGIKTAIFVMDSGFMMGSMGTVVGEKITRLFEYAIMEKLPVVGFTVSGGARMQEGILSLMQMAKISGAVGRHSREGLLYIAYLTDPTTGGVTASFAMEGDIILAEPGALIGFAGARVIEQTIRQKLPSGFQRSEFLLEKGFIDKIIDRREMSLYIAKILKLHASEK